MSYDFEIATHREPQTHDVKEALSGKASLEGVLEARGNLLVRTARWEFTIDGPFHVEVEALPDALSAAVLAPKWLVQINVPIAAPKVARTLATKIATTIAKTCAGAAYDPQEDRILYPRSGRSPKPARSNDERKRGLECEWCYAPGQLAKSGEAFLAVVRARLPEAAPVRYGAFEPLQHRFADDQAAFLELWLKESKTSGSFFWTCKSPGVDGGVNWPFENEANARRGGVAAARLRVELEGDSLTNDSQWRETAQDFFREVAMRTGAFYGRAILSPPKPRLVTAGESYDLAKPAAVFGGRWFGIPRHPAWLSWLGDTYQSRLAEKGAAPGDSTASHRGSLLVAPKNLDSPFELHKAIPSDLYRLQDGRSSGAVTEQLGPHTRFHEAPLSLDPRGA